MRFLPPAWRGSADEREVIEAASVIGQQFVQDALEELVSERVRESVPELLEALMQKRLVRLEQPEVALEQRYRFGHILIRDATYRGLLKASRAVLHERFVGWADRVNQGPRPSRRVRGDPGLSPRAVLHVPLRARPAGRPWTPTRGPAAARLSSAGQRAFARGDMPAAANLLRRAVALLPTDSHDRLTRLPDLAEAMMAIGEFAWAETFLDEAIEMAAQAGEEGSALAPGSCACVSAAIRPSPRTGRGGWSPKPTVACHSSRPPATT